MIRKRGLNRRKTSEVYSKSSYRIPYYNYLNEQLIGTELKKIMIIWPTEWRKTVGTDTSALRTLIESPGLYSCSRSNSRYVDFESSSPPPSYGKKLWIDAFATLLVNR